MPRVTHFVFACKARNLTPTWEMFNIFNTMMCNTGFFSFAAQLNVNVVGTDLLRSMHDWKQKFFYIRAGVIQLTFHKPEIKVQKEKLIDYANEDWYLTLTARPSLLK
ncbi:hypothetical protein Hanom_Chr06g00556421 [Helianthus anomalus]